MSSIKASGKSLIPKEDTNITGKKSQSAKQIRKVIPKHQLEIENSAKQLKELIESHKENVTGSNKVQILIKSVASLSFKDKETIFRKLSQIGKDAPLTMKIRSPKEDTKNNIINAKVSVTKRLQDELKNIIGEKDIPFEDAPLALFKKTYENLESSEKTTSQQKIYSDNNIECVLFDETNQSSQQQVFTVANEIVNNLMQELEPENLENGAFIFSVLGNNSREGLDVNLQVYLKVVEAIENLSEFNLTQENKDSLLNRFQERAVFLCTGSAGKGTSLNYSVGKVAASLKPEFASKLFNEDGSIKSLEILRSSNMINEKNELTISKVTDLSAPQGLQQLTTKKESETVTIKLSKNEKNEITGAVVKEGEDIIENPIEFPLRRSGKPEQPALLFGNTEAEFNEQIIKEQFKLINIKREKESKSILSPNIKTEPNSANTGQNMQMGAEKINQFCTEKDLTLNESILVQAQRMQQSARTMPTALSQFSVEGLNGPPAFKQIYNIDAQFNPSVSANQTSDRQVIDIINSLKEFAQAIKYSLGDPEKAFYGAIDISSSNFDTFMTLTQQLMDGLKNSTSKEIHNISLKDTLNFYSELWPGLESLIKQGSDTAIKDNLTDSHAIAVIRQYVLDTKGSIPKSSNVQKEINKAKLLRKEISELNTTQKKVFEIFGNKVLEKVNNYITNTAKANRGTLLKENYEQIKQDLKTDNPEIFNQYVNMIDSIKVDEEDPFLTVANFAMQTTRPLYESDQIENPRTN